MININDLLAVFNLNKEEVLVLDNCQQQLKSNPYTIKAVYIRFWEGLKWIGGYSNWQLANAILKQHTFLVVKNRLQREDQQKAHHLALFILNIVEGKITSNDWQQIDVDELIDRAMHGDGMNAPILNKNDLKIIFKAALNNLIEELDRLFGLIENKSHLNLKIDPYQTSHFCKKKEFYLDLYKKIDSFSKRDYLESLKLLRKDQRLIKSKNKYLYGHFRSQSI